MKLKNKINLFEDGKFYCPHCQNLFTESDYLKEAIDNINTRWIANMVTHHRHVHITYWEKCWSSGGKNYMKNWFTDYETEKQKINERAKRELLRKHFDFLLEHKICKQDFLGLEENEEETIELIDKKYLSKNNKP